MRINIDNQEYSFPPNWTVLQALRKLGQDLPAPCYDPRLKPYGACRLCLVEIEGTAHPMAACTTQIQEGMVVHTHSAQLEAARRDEVRFLLSHYPKAGLSESPDKPFNQHLEHLGLTQVLSEQRDPSKIDDSHPYLRVDMNQCILCYRCVRICADLQGQSVWQAFDKEHHTHIQPDGSNLLDSSCVSCGACADSCPTGAIVDKTVLEYGAPTAWTKSICPYCGVGCELEVGTREGRIVQVRPSLEGPSNKGHLCVKGRYAFEYTHASDRITEPMIRRNGAWEQVSWPEVMQFVADELRRIQSTHGLDSLAVLGSARASNEENYLAQKFARLVLHNNNIDCCARVCHGPSAAALGKMFGTGAATSCFDDIELAQTFMLSGTNTSEDHPVVASRIKQAVRKGAKLIVIDPRKTEMAEWATLHLAPKPGTDIPLFHALAHVILQENLTDPEFLTQRAEGLETYQQVVTEWTPERAEEVCGVSAETIRQVARLYATHKPSIMFHGLGLTEHLQGTENVMAQVNLALLTGNLGKPGTGVNPLRGQNNVQGSAHMGCEPSRLTGYVPIAQAKGLFESVWKASVPESKGMNLLEMMDAAAEGRLKALWCIGYDIYLTNADVNQTAKALENLELLIVQDLFMNETAKAYAKVFLPVCSNFEKDGSFMNSERRVQRIRQVLPPLGNSKPDWQVICDLGGAMGYAQAFDFASPEAIWNEVRQVWPAGAGISYTRLEQGGLQWPCPTLDHPGTQRLHASAFPTGPKATLQAIPYLPNPEQPSAEYPFLLITGRTLYSFNAGTMTGRTRNITLRDTDYLEVAPLDAQRLNLVDGAKVWVKSPYGEAMLPVQISERVKPGELFSTFHDPAVFLNRVTNPHRDRITSTPAYKRTAVRLEAV